MEGHQGKFWEKLILIQVTGHPTCPFLIPKGNLIWNSRFVPTETENKESVGDDQVIPREKENRILQQKCQELEQKNTELQTQCLVFKTQLEEKEKMINTLLLLMNNNKEPK